MKSISLQAIGGYETGIFDESAAEIVSFDPVSQRLFVVNANNGLVDVLNISDPTNPLFDFNIGTEALDLPADRTVGGINSVAVKNGIIAAAVEIVDANDNSRQLEGMVAFFDTNGNFLKNVQVGFLPDMLTFTSDGMKVLVANEGEPNSNYTYDPEGSVSIIDLSGGINNLTQDDVTTADFTSFNDQKEALINAGVRIFGPNATVAQDFEPEYIAVSPDNQTAFVTLQENNAFAVVNINDGVIENILPLGYKDHSQEGNTIDVSDRDGTINLQNWPIFGMYLPDAIASYEVDGQTYYITANEGDARIRPDGDLEDDQGNVILEEGEIFNEESRIKDLDLDPTVFPNAQQLQADEQLGRLTITNTLGDTDGDGDFDQLYAFGGRSFTIWDENGNLVYDSGDQFEKITASQVPSLFNSQGAIDSFDTRSDNKGPEPEGVVTGKVGEQTYAFIGLERIGGVMVYDVTNPISPQFVEYKPAENGDISPEGLNFIPAEDSPNGEPLLVVTNEVSGSTRIYQINTPPMNIFGGINDDTLGAETGFEGKNSLTFVGGGNDLIDTSHSSQGNNRIYGGSGNDTIIVSTKDIIFAGEGDDEIIATQGQGDNRLYGGNGNDTFTLGSNDILFGGNGDDRFYVTTGGDNVIMGGQGVDQFWLATGGELPSSSNTIIDFNPNEDILGIGGNFGLELDSFEDLDIQTNQGITTISLINFDNQELAILKGEFSLTEDNFVFES